MKNIAYLFIASLLLISCGNDAPETNLDILNSNKTTILTKIDSLTKELRTIEAQIAKLDTTKKAHLVTILPVKNENFKHFIEIQGVVQADKNIEIRPEMGGTVTTIYVKEGQKVSAGQTLIQLDDSSIKNNIAELTTQLNLAKTTFDRQERLWNQKIGSEMQYLQAKAQKEGLQRSIATLATQAKKMKVIAPFSGIVDEISPRIGELTSPQTAVVRLINLDKVYVEADVTETYLPVIKVGSEAVLNFPSISKEITAAISQIGNYINPDNRSFKTRINIANSDQTIKPNLMVDLKILDFQQEGIIIPSTLVQKDQAGKDYVFTLVTENGESKVVKNLITITNEYNNEVFVTEGLKATDTLVNKGARIVKADDIVKISK